MENETLEDTQPLKWDHDRARSGHIFSLGHLVMTPGAESTFDEKTRTECLQRHAKGDWGEGLDPEDVAANNEAIVSNGQILSVYTIEGKGSLWIISEADRSITTLLLPSEY
jgi:hypothetical protein